jgi:type II secretory pathway component PulJ
MLIAIVISAVILLVLLAFMETMTERSLLRWRR